LLKIDIEVFSCSLLTILSSVVLQVLFLSETRLVAGGFDCNPMLFEIDQNGVWEFITFLDEGKGAAVEPISDTLLQKEDSSGWAMRLQS
jgi:hypothetical protein